jgi:chromosome segregation ATPase
LKAQLSKLADLQTENQDLKSQLSKVADPESTFNDLTRDLAVEQAQVKSLKLQLKRLQDGSQNTQPRLSEELRAEKARADELKEKVDALEGQIVQMRENGSGQARQALARSKQSAAQIGEMAKRIRELADENARLKGAGQEEMARLEGELADARFGSELQRQRIERLVARNRELEAANLRLSASAEVPGGGGDVVFERWGDCVR